MEWFYKKIYTVFGWDFVRMRVEIRVEETPEPAMHGRVLTGRIIDVIKEVQLDGTNQPELRKGLFPIIQLDTTVAHIGMKADYLLSIPMGEGGRSLYKACVFSTWFHHFLLTGPRKPKEVLWQNVIGRWPMRLLRK
jgi:hypothetical protein